MTPARWQAIEKVFGAAADQPITERAAFVRAACGEDLELANEVLSLLAPGPEASSALRVIVGDELARVAGLVRADARSGQRIGAFRIGEVLGEGGMGVVYAAVRDDAAFRQRVAIKVLKHGVPPERLRDERQILATLEHPHIVRLLDGGTTADGLPYLVMERIDGGAITETRVALPGRLADLRVACGAVAYAHGKGVIHRDLKPSNILVDREGRVKLLDFGIAKLADDTDRESRTRTGSALMTPQYASPEQLRGERVTAATDVYSLGAVLYELVTGRPPRTGTLFEILRNVQPITRPPEAPPGLAAILETALADEPEHRYASAAALGDDLGRYLAGERVAAAAPVRRSRRRSAGFAAAAAAAAAVAVLVMAGALGSGARDDAPRTPAAAPADAAPRPPAIAFRSKVLHLTGNPYGVALDPAGAQLQYYDGHQIAGYDFATGGTAALPLADGMKERLSDGRFIQQTSSDGSTPLELHAGDGTVRKLVVGAVPAGSPDGKRAAIIQDHWLCILDLATLEVRRLVDLHALPYDGLSPGPSPVWSRDGQYLLWSPLAIGSPFAHAATELLHLTRVSDGVTRTLPVPVVAQSILYSPAAFVDAEHVLYCAERGGEIAIQLYSITDGSERRVELLDGDVSACHITTGGDRAVVNVIRSRVRLGVLDLATRPALVHTFGRAGEGVQLGELAPGDDRVLVYDRAAGSGDQPQPQQPPQLRAIALADAAVTPVAACAGEWAVARRGDDVLHFTRAAGDPAVIAAHVRPDCSDRETWAVPVGALPSVVRCARATCIAAAYTGGGGGGGVTVWRLARGAVAAIELAHYTPDLRSAALSVAITPDEAWAVVLAGEGDAVHLVPVRGGGAVRVLALDKRVIPTFVSATRDAQHIFIAVQTTVEQFGGPHLNLNLIRAAFDGSYEAVWDSYTEYVSDILASPRSDLVVAAIHPTQTEVIELDRVR